MASGVSFLVPENDLLEDSDAVERCPNNRYIRYNDVLGKGALKTVYKGFDEVEGIEIAWNQVKLNDDAMQSPQKRLYSDLHLLQTLKHENIIKSYVSWVDDDDDDTKTINIITELFTSGSLTQYRKKHKSVDLKAIKNWARQILKGLEYLHNQEPTVIHGDLKCDNVFVNGNHGQVKLGHIGIGTTPEFMAPELYEEDEEVECNELVDIYSFGMCILELITCESPYSECSNSEEIYKKVTSGVKPTSLSKVKDLEVKEFIEKCLVHVSKRLPASELLKDPFLNPENIKSTEVNLSPIEIDFDSSSQRVQSLEMQCLNERNEIKLKGEKSEDNSVLLTLRIDDFSGEVKSIEFPFYLEADTAHTIALEMVEQRDLIHADVNVVVDLIDDLIMKFVPTWKPSFPKSNSSGIISSPEGSVIVPQEGDKVLSSSGDFWNMNMFDDDPSDEDREEEEEECEDLKQEIDDINVHYDQILSELMKLKEIEIENAKKRWMLKKKKKVAVF